MSKPGKITMVPAPVEPTPTAESIVDALGRVLRVGESVIIFADRHLRPLSTPFIAQITKIWGGSWQSAQIVPASGTSARRHHLILESVHPGQFLKLLDTNAPAFGLQVCSRCGHCMDADRAHTPVTADEIERAFSGMNRTPAFPGCNTPSPALSPNASGQA